VKIWLSLPVLPPSILCPYLSHLSVQVWSIYSFHFLISFNHSKNPFQSSYLITSWIQSSTPLFSHPFIIHSFIQSFIPAFYQCFGSRHLSTSILPWGRETAQHQPALPEIRKRWGFLLSATAALVPEGTYIHERHGMWMDGCMYVCMYVLLYCTISVWWSNNPWPVLLSGGHHPGGNQSITHTIPYYTIRGVRLGSLVGWYWLVLDLVGSGWVWSDSSSMWCDVMWCAFLSYYYRNTLVLKQWTPPPPLITHSLFKSLASSHPLVSVILPQK